MISTNEIINKNGKSTGLKISKAYSTSMRAKDLPDFGSPVGNKNTISTLTKQLKSSFDLNSQDATTKQLLGAIGQPKMLFSETEDVGLEIGHMVFTQKFAIIEATHTPKIKQPDGGHFRTEAQSQLFQCESGYATTCGDGCNAESEE